VCVPSWPGTAVPARTQSGRSVPIAPGNGCSRDRWAGSDRDQLDRPECADFRKAPKPNALIQQDPRVTTWYAMTCFAPGMTAAAISRVAGASATHGAVSGPRGWIGHLRFVTDRPAPARSGRCKSCSRESMGMWPAR
jgi:hypothetical protein